MGDLVIQDIEKAEICNEGKGRDWENEEPSAVGDHTVQGHLRNLKEHKSMGHEIHPLILRDLAEEVAKLLPITYEKL